MFAQGNSFGNSGQSGREESAERPGNSWLFRVSGVQKLGNAL